MALTRSYNPSLVTMTWAGQIIGGFAEGTFIEVERNEDAFSLVVGAGGEAARVMNRNRSGRVTLTLLASSQSNDVLSAIQNTDELSATGVAPLFLKELNGTTACHSENAWLMRPANVERAKEMSEVQWVFECEDLNMFVGGLL